MPHPKIAPDSVHDLDPITAHYPRDVDARVAALRAWWGETVFTATWVEALGMEWQGVVR